MLDTRITTVVDGIMLKLYKSGMIRPNGCDSWVRELLGEELRQYADLCVDDELYKLKREHGIK